MSIFGELEFQWNWYSTKKSNKNLLFRSETVLPISPKLPKHLDPTNRNFGPFRRSIRPTVGKTFRPRRRLRRPPRKFYSAARLDWKSAFPAKPVNTRKISGALGSQTLNLSKKSFRNWFFKMPELLLGPQAQRERTFLLSLKCSWIGATTQTFLKSFYKLSC